MLAGPRPARKVGHFGKNSVLEVSPCMVTPGSSVRHRKWVIPVTILFSNFAETLPDMKQYDMQHRLLHNEQSARQRGPVHPAGRRSLLPCARGT